jgi:hypothetical protein
LATGLVGEAAALGPALIPKGATLAEKVGSGVLRIGGISALEGLLSGIGRGEDPESRGVQGAVGAGTGLVTGGIIGGILPVAGAAFRAVMKDFKGGTDRRIAKKLGISRGSAQILREALENDDFDAAMAAILRAGDQTMLADASESFKNILDIAIQEGGRAARVGREAVQNRAQQANQRLQGYLDKILEPPKGPLSLKRQIMSESEEARRSLYDPAYAVPIRYNTPMGEQLKGLIDRVPEEALKNANALMRVRGETSAALDFTVRNDGTIDFVTMPDVRQIDYIKRALQDMSRGRPSKDFLSQSYDQLARELRDTVSQENPLYAAAVKKGGDVIQDREAVDIGYNLFRTRAGLRRVTREEAEEVLLNASETQRRAARRGARIAIDDELADIKRTATDPNTDVRELHKIMNGMTGRAAERKMELLLGKEGAEELVGKIEEALTAVELSAAIARNSKTAVRQAMQRGREEAVRPGIAKQVLLGVVGRPGEIPIAAGVQTLVRAMAGDSPEAIRIRELNFNDEITDILTRTGDDQAIRYAEIINDAIIEGRKLKPSQAELIAGYIIKRAGPLGITEMVSEAIEPDTGASQPAQNQARRQGVPQ